MNAIFRNAEWLINNKPGYESWYFMADVEDLEPLRAWLPANLAVYEANAMESIDQSYHSIFIRFSSADDAALFKLAWS
jgi:hypothetical protein